MLKDIKLVKGMSKDDINKLMPGYIQLEDKMYMGMLFSHNWKCKCGEIITNRSFATIKRNHSVKCDSCRGIELETKYKHEVEKTGEYEYIRSYSIGSIMPNGKTVNGSRYIQIKHVYCNQIYYVRANNFINTGYRCIHCCHKYENSFAHYIEVELGEPLEKYWDFEKNTVNPYHIYKSSHKKVWIKCLEKDYHGSYEITCNNFINNQRCSYCGNHKVHPKDSFAQYHIDNTDPDFLEKYWDYDKNTVNPWGISPSNVKKVWIKCQEKDYHESYDISCCSFTKGNRCQYCASKKVHLYDSFGYHHFDKVQSWHPDNDVSPFKLSLGNDKKYKFICKECGIVFQKAPCKIVGANEWCPECSMSKGEKKIVEWLRYNGIEYEYEKTYKGLIGLGGGSLSYDFYLPKYNLLIEYQGIQHEKYNKAFHKSYYDFEKQLEHDNRKYIYALEHGIKLIEIRESEFSNIELILISELKEE